MEVSLYQVLHNFKILFITESLFLMDAQLREIARSEFLIIIKSWTLYTQIIKISI